MAGSEGSPQRERSRVALDTHFSTAASFEREQCARERNIPASSSIFSSCGLTSTRAVVANDAVGNGGILVIELSLRLRS